MIKALYDDIQIGDIVCVKLNDGYMDVNSLGQVIRKLDKSIYDDMKVIGVDYFHRTRQLSREYPGIYAPNELVKLSTQQLYHIVKCEQIWKYHTNIQIKR